MIDEYIPPKGYLLKNSPDNKIWSGKEWVKLQSEEGKKILQEVIDENK